MAQRSLHRLTERAVKTLGVGMHCDGGGLYLQVTEGVGANLCRSWLYRYTALSTGAVEAGAKGKRGRERQMGLGRYPDVSLAEAREKAREARKLRAEGVDPLEARDAKRVAAAVADAKTMTFDQCSDAYIRAHQAGWRNAKHGAQWAATLKAYVSPVCGKLPVEAIDTGLVMRALEPIWATKPETASRVRGRIESVLAWATVRGFRHGPNPAQWKNHLDTLLPARAKVRRVQHHTPLPYNDMPAFMKALRKQEGVAARALEFTILTAARTGEIVGANWDEIDLAEKIWTIPADRMKGGREHRVPLSDGAFAILKTQEAGRESKFVFPGQRGALSNMAFLMLMRRMGVAVTAHGFRSAFRDWAGDCTHFQRETIDAALAHVAGGKVEIAYRRSDALEKRRNLMEEWSRFCAGASAQGVVLPFVAVV